MTILGIDCATSIASAALVASTAQAQSVGRIAGTVTDIGDNFVTVEIADGVRIRVQKAAVGNVLPKGTLKSA